MFAYVLLFWSSLTFLVIGAVLCIIVFLKELESVLWIRLAFVSGAISAIIIFMANIVTSATIGGANSNSDPKAITGVFSSAASLLFIILIAVTSVREIRIKFIGAPYVYSLRIITIISFIAVAISWIVRFGG